MPGTGSPLADNGDESLKSIAEAAEELGVTQRTLRFYEDKGLIAPQRVGTMRVYSRREMGRMMLILRGKRLGFSIRRDPEDHSQLIAEIEIVPLKPMD